MGKSSNKATKVSKPSQVKASAKSKQAYLANTKKVEPVKIKGYKYAF